MNLNAIHNVYLIGIGGIGMSALARYFHYLGKSVGGYDKTPSSLTQELQKENIHVHFEDDIKLIPENFKNKTHTLIIYTPAIPLHHSELVYFKENDFEIKKRSVVLGEISK